MLKQASMVDLVSSLKKQIEKATAVTCYDAVPLNAPSPFYYVQVVGKRSDNTKTSYRDVFSVWIHAIAPETESSVPIFDMIQVLEETMTQDIELPEPFQVLLQSNTGMQSLRTDETGEKHAVLAYDITVFYGFKTKI